MHTSTKADKVALLASRCSRWDDRMIQDQTSTTRASLRRGNNRFRTGRRARLRTLLPERSAFPLFAAIRRLATGKARLVTSRGCFIDLMIIWRWRRSQTIALRLLVTPAASRANSRENTSETKQRITERSTWSFRARGLNSCKTTQRNLPTCSISLRTATES